MVELVLGDCLNAMKDLEADSIDTVITDPPCSLGKELEKLSLL